MRQGNEARIDHDNTQAQTAPRAASRSPSDPDEPEDLPKDLWFEPYRRPATDRARAVVEDVTYQVQSLEVFRQARERKRRATDQARFEATVSAVVCYAMHHHLLGSPGDGLVVTRSKAVLSRASRYRPAILTDQFPYTIDLLCEPEMAFLEQAKGGPSEGFDPARRTTIKAGSSLIHRIEDHGITFADLTVSDDAEVIILHDQPRTRVEYQDTEQTQRYRAEVITINAWLRDANITFDHEAAKRTAITHGLEHFIGRFGTSATAPVDVTDRKLRRIFSRNSFRSGGRLFGGFWQGLHKQVRNAALRIEGEPVVTLDYTAMNPMLAYGLMGEEPPPDDPYTLPGLEAHRDGVKQLFNALLFDTERRKKFPMGVKASFPHKVKVGQVIDAIEHKHPKLAPVLHTGAGHAIQFTEGRIMLQVLLALREQKIVALPVFDALVVKASVADKAEAAMIEAFAALTDLKTTVKREQV